LALRLCNGDSNKALHIAYLIEAPSQRRNLIEIQSLTGASLMWRKFLLASASSMALAGTALAADLAVAPPPPPVFTWTGLYVGGYGGGEITHTSYNTLVGTPFAGPAYLVGRPRT
jgi:hypothetical protein